MSALDDLAEIVSRRPFMAQEDRWNRLFDRDQIKDCYDLVYREVSSQGPRIHNQWPHLIGSWSSYDIHRATLCHWGHKEWQLLRQSMRGISTYWKLEFLAWYYDAYTYTAAAYRRASHCRCDNYINVLRRHGFLDVDLVILR